MQPPSARAKQGLPHGREPGPHHFTLLDGEMVVDEDLVADKRIRRYLAYDLVLDNNRNLCKLPFSVSPPSSLFCWMPGCSSDVLGG